MLGKLFLALLTWSLFATIAVYFTAVFVLYAHIRGWLPK